MPLDAELGKEKTLARPDVLVMVLAHVADFWGKGAHDADWERRCSWWWWRVGRWW